MQTIKNAFVKPYCSDFTKELYDSLFQHSHLKYIALFFIVLANFVWFSSCYLIPRF